MTSRMLSTQHVNRRHEEKLHALEGQLNAQRMRVRIKLREDTQRLHEDLIHLSIRTPSASLLSDPYSGQRDARSAHTDQRVTGRVSRPVLGIRAKTDLLSELNPPVHAAIGSLYSTGGRMHEGVNDGQGVDTRTGWMKSTSPKQDLLLKRNAKSHGAEKNLMRSAEASHLSESEKRAKIYLYGEREEYNQNSEKIFMSSILSTKDKNQEQSHFPDTLTPDTKTPHGRRPFPLSDKSQSENSGSVSEKSESVSSKTRPASEKTPRVPEKSRPVAEKPRPPALTAAVPSTTRVLDVSNVLKERVRPTDVLVLPQVYGGVNLLHLEDTENGTHKHAGDTNTHQESHIHDMLHKDVDSLETCRLRIRGESPRIRMRRVSNNVNPLAHAAADTVTSTGSRMRKGVNAVHTQDTPTLTKTDFQRGRGRARFFTRAQKPLLPLVEVQGNKVSVHYQESQGRPAHIKSFVPNSRTRTLLSRSNRISDSLARLSQRKAGRLNEAQEECIIQVVDTTLDDADEDSGSVDQTEHSASERGQASAKAFPKRYVLKTVSAARKAFRGSARSRRVSVGDPGADSSLSGWQLMRFYSIWSSSRMPPLWSTSSYRSRKQQEDKKHRRRSTVLRPRVRAASVFAAVSALESAKKSAFCLHDGGGGGDGDGGDVKVAARLWIKSAKSGFSVNSGAKFGFTASD